MAANQSAKTDLEKNDLQVGMGTADNTGSKIEFSSMVHSMGLVNLTLGSKTVPSTRVFKPGSTSEKLFDRAPTTSITATSNFTASVSSNSTSTYNKSTGIYLLVGKPSTTVAFTGSSSEKYTWNSTTYTFSKNTGEVKTVTPSRKYDNAGWGYGAVRAEQTFTAYAGVTYMLEVWGSAARNSAGSWAGATPGKGGYSNGKLTPNIQTTLYVYVGDSLMYNGGGAGGTGSVENLACGGGATHIATASGILSSLSSSPSSVLIVAGGGGGCEWDGQGGYGGGKSGGDGSITILGESSALGAKGARENSGGTSCANYNGVVVDGSFGQGGSGYSMIGSVKDSGGGGGGGWYGGGGTSYAGAGGGGSGHVNSSVLTDAVTIAGNESFVAPSGKKETGHSESGYAIITQLSY